MNVEVSKAMANKNLFKSLVGRLIPATDAVNSEQAPAYSFTPKHALAQYAATGCMNSTFYASGQEQLSKVLELCESADPAFIARLAVYAREQGHMKDVPALLLAVLSVRDRALFAKTFPRVCDNAKVLRTFVQILRSGVVGRKSLGTLPKRMVREWLEARDDEELFRSSVGQSPSLADLVRMVPPRPRDARRRALYVYLVGRDCDREALPAAARDYESFK